MAFCKTNLLVAPILITANIKADSFPAWPELFRLANHLNSVGIFVKVLYVVSITEYTYVCVAAGN